jgi:hypothetical protein
MLPTWAIQYTSAKNEKIVWLAAVLIKLHITSLTSNELWIYKVDEETMAACTNDTPGGGGHTQDFW